MAVYEISDELYARLKKSAAALGFTPDELATEFCRRWLQELNEEQRLKESAQCEFNPPTEAN